MLESEWKNGKELFKPNVIPSCFLGMKIYDQGRDVTNQNSGDSYKLTAIELSMYDAIRGIRSMIEKGLANEDYIKTLYIGLEWFKETNPEAYKILF